MQYVPFSSILTFAKAEHLAEHEKVMREPCVQYEPCPERCFCHHFSCQTAKLSLKKYCCMHCVCASGKCIVPFEAMAASDAMPRRPRRFHHAMPCLVILCVAWLLFDALHQLSFVQGSGWSGHMVIQRQVTRRLGQKGQQTAGEQDVADDKAKVKKLTLGMKKARSAKELMDVLDEAMGGPIFDFIHASAAYTQLVTLKRRRCLQQKDWDSPVLLRLNARVEDMALQGQLRARETANVLWSLAQLSDRFSISTQLLAALVKSVPTKVKGMDAQGLSNSLWACAKLKDVAPDVLEAVPAIVAQIPNKAKDMKPQELSNCLWASAQLKNVAPAVLEAVPAIVAQIPNKAKDMIPQHLSNCLLGHLRSSKMLRLLFWRRCRPLWPRSPIEQRT